ncbi:site-specific DNA-methyltransferase [bacterium]|nr:MAG: site-specific DNA-methyltransferase [bacterium]
MNGKSLDTKEDLKNKLREIAPQVFNEDKIDWEKLKATFGDDINFTDERYVLNWAGKSDAFRAIQTQTTATLIPDKDESVNFDDTGNFFIEGENLKVLKVLQKAYYGKIKMIYIDPPYNTGNDFIYNDKFSEKKDEYLLRSGEKDEEGLLTNENLYRKNSKESGHYHSNWLTMMYPRLFLARNLLRDDGIIFVSIDDNEVHNLRMLMNEIFGEENFVECIIWKKRYQGAKEKHLVSIHEYILFYAKKKELLLPIYISSDTDYINKYYIHKDDLFKIRGPYRTQPLEAGKSMGDRRNLIYPILAPEGSKIFPKRQWIWSRERVDISIQRKELGFRKEKNNKWSVFIKQYLKDENGNIRETKAFSIIDNVFTQHGTNEILKLFGSGNIFPFPKPSALIKQIINIGLDNSEDEIILDFYAGSSSTAHAVLDLNKDDNGHRKFIMVQLPEKTDEKSEAYKAGFETIADIGKERIRRVIKKIEDENKENLNFGENKQDLGFKVFKLQKSNFKIWRGDKFETGEELEKQLHVFVNPVKEEATEEDMLYELLLKSGIDLNCKIEKIPLSRGVDPDLSEDGVCYYLINENELVIALSKINEEIVKEIIKTKPQKVITLDKLFEGDDQLKTNTILQMKDAGIEFKVV